MADGMNKRLSRAPTLADVAAAAGVDQSTVSRVLRDDSNARVGKETRIRILDAARELAYAPNAYGRGLANRRTLTLALLIPGPSNFVYADIVRGAADEARTLGYVLVVADASDLGRANDAVERLVREGRVDGLLLASGTASDQIPDAVGGLENCIVLNRRIGGGSPSVIEDDEEGMRLATEELLAAGHQAIGCIAGPRDVDTAQRRVAGYQRAILDAGLALDPRLVVHGRFDEASGYKSASSLLELPERPTALAVASLSSAIGALSAAANQGVDVPNDLSVIAFHDAPIAEFLSPPLTTVAMPLYQLGVTGARMLHRHITGHAVPSLTTVVDPPPRLVRRSSVAIPR